MSNVTHRWSGGNKNNLGKGLGDVWKDVELKAIFYGGEGARKCAEHLFNASQEIVPVKSGTLKSSGVVRENKNTKSSKQAWEVVYDTIKYSDDETSHRYNYNYAVITHARVREYLGEPYRQNAELYKQMIADELKKVFGGK